MTGNKELSDALETVKDKLLELHKLACPVGNGKDCQTLICALCSGCPVYKVLDTLPIINAAFKKTN